ncbi:MAG: glycine cleavage system protein R, partial [Gammaproteobacteria bacterium]|nr:glycine cleavage system protein R [Gammaproteobacteria bacterium]
MTTKLVISALGNDRPGIVDELTNIIYTNNLNVEDSRMTVLGGEFAILLLVSGNAENIENLSTQVEDIEQTLHMRLLLKPTSTPTNKDHSIPYAVNVAALDHPGIVHNLSEFFSSRKINIMDLQTERYAAPHTGSPMFALHMTIGLTAQTNIAELREAFMDFCDERNLDAVLT